MAERAPGFKWFEPLRLSSETLVSNNPLPFKWVNLCRYATVELLAPSVVEEVHGRWVTETLQAARQVTSPAGHTLGENVPIGQHAMHAKREHEVFKRLRWLHAKLAVDEVGRCTLNQVDP
jgi:hypothetical protein